MGRVVNGEFSAFTKLDIRAKFLAEMGFATPPALDDITEEAFYIRLSPEIVKPIDADVVIWYGGTDGLDDALEYPARPFLHANVNGGEIFLTDTQLAAVARHTLLSIPVTIDTLVPMLEQAADGDPDTPVEDDLL